MTIKSRLKNRGFTLVEVLIVITVIGILSAIVLVTWQGARDRADTASRLSELVAWRTLYKAYYAANGKWPQYSGAPDADSPGNSEGGKGYCLGTGFPNSDGSGRGNCRDTASGYWSDSTGGTLFHVNSELNALLATAGKLPSGLRNVPTKTDPNKPLGPFARYFIGGNVILYSIFKGNTCPKGTTNVYGYDGSAVMCQIDLGQG